jgi:hypothetical protein
MNPVKRILSDDQKARFVKSGVQIPVSARFTWSSGRIGYVHEESLPHKSRKLASAFGDWVPVESPSFFGSSDKHNGAALLNNTDQHRGARAAYRFLNR